MIGYASAAASQMPAAADLRAQMSREMGNDFDAAFPKWRTRFSEYFEEKQAARRSEVFLAFDGEDAVGCTIVSILDDYRNYVFNTPTAWVNAVYVRPAYRRRGIARRLMQMAIDWSRDRGCIRVRLRSSDEGVHLYTALGFVTGREMQLDLK